MSRGLAFMLRIQSGEDVKCPSCDQSLVLYLLHSGHHPGVYCPNGCISILLEIAVEPASTGRLSGGTPPNPRQLAFFDEHGYLLLERFLSTKRVERLREALEARYALEGEEAGWEQPGTRQNVRRLCNLFSKGEPFLELATDLAVYRMAQHVIGSEFRWQAFNAHDPLPGQPTRQAIHADRQFFPGCAAYLNVLVALDDLTEENGATRLVPGSHRKPWPREALPDREAALAPVEGEILLTAPAGSLVFVHGDTWHGARDNHSTGTRRVLHLGFACPNTAPQYEIAATLPESVRHRLGPLAVMLAPLPPPLASE